MFCQITVDNKIGLSENINLLQTLNVILWPENIFDQNFSYCCITISSNGFLKCYFMKRNKIPIKILATYAEIRVFFKSILNRFAFRSIGINLCQIVKYKCKQEITLFHNINASIYKTSDGTNGRMRT